MPSRAMIQAQSRSIGRGRTMALYLDIVQEAETLPYEHRRHGWDANWIRSAANGDWRHSPRINYANHLFFPAYFDRDQLYDLRTDVLEQQNLFGRPQHRQVQDAMRQQLGHLLHNTNQQFGEFTMPMEATAALGNPKPNAAQDLRATSGVE